MIKLPGDPFVSLELVHDPSRGAVDPGGLNHLVIQTPDLRSTVASLAGKGIEAREPACLDEDTDFWTSWVTDPDGYGIELVQWPAGHPEGMTAEDLQDGPAD
jgi:lactoylglutathione lyase